jgi:hypothetical protein
MKIKLIIFIVMLFIVNNIFANEDVDIIINDYQFSSNLISIQLKIINNTDHNIIIPGHVSQKQELVDNTLIITYFYDWPKLPEEAFGLLEFSPSYFIGIGETIYYSIFLVNENVSVLRFAIADDDMYDYFNNFLNKNEPIINTNERAFYKSFNKILGTVKNIKINMGIIKGVGNIDNYIYQLSRNRTELEIITMEHNFEEPVIIKYKNIEIE